MQMDLVIVRDIYVFTYVDITTLNVKRHHEFERKQGEVYRKFGRRKEKGEIM